MTFFETESLVLRQSTAVPQALQFNYFYGRYETRGEPRAPYSPGQPIFASPGYAIGYFVLLHLPGEGEPACACRSGLLQHGLCVRRGGRNFLFDRDFAGVKSSTIPLGLRDRWIGNSSVRLFIVVLLGAADHGSAVSRGLFGVCKKYWEVDFGALRGDWRRTDRIRCFYPSGARVSRGGVFCGAVGGRNRSGSPAWRRPNPNKQTPIPSFRTVPRFDASFVCLNGRGP